MFLISSQREYKVQTTFYVSREVSKIQEPEFRKLSAQNWKLKKSFFSRHMEGSIFLQES